MNRAVSAIFASGLLLALSSGCSSTPANADDGPSLNLSILEQGAPAAYVVVTVRAEAKRVQVTALQWTFRYAGDLISPVSFAVGPKSLEAKKTIECASQKDETRCILWGSNTKPIPDGDIAEARFRLRARSQISKAAITLDHSFATSSDGELLAVIPTFSTVNIVANDTARGPESGSGIPKDTHHKRRKDVKTTAAVERL